jgi:hypothetical protein
VLFYQRLGTQPGARTLRDGEAWKACFLRLSGITLDHAIERCVAVLMYLAALCRCGIRFRTVPQLARAEIFRNFADALFDVVLAETKRPPFDVDTAQGDVNVRVLCVVVRYCHPFHRRAEVPLHS